MVPKLNPRGTSFRGLSNYLFHDKDQASTSDRLAWSDMQNCWSSRPQDAWCEMMDTAQNADALKLAAGVDRRGRRNDKPVLHYTLAWHPDEKPTVDQMKGAALESLKALKLQDHQAIIVGHNDQAHAHLHIMVNTVHPETGKTADLKFTKEHLSRWAEQYERDHGGIRCEQREENNASRAAIRKKRDQEKQESETAWAGANPPVEPQPYKPVKDTSPSRPEWIDKKQIIDRMKAMHAEIKPAHDQERSALFLKQKAERVQFEAKVKKAIDVTRDTVKQEFKPKWRDLYRDQKAEMRHLKRAANHPFERAAFVFSNASRLAGEGKKLGLRATLGLILIPGRLETRLAITHERERQVLSKTQRNVSKLRTDRIEGSHRAELTSLRARQEGQRTAVLAQHQANRDQVTFAAAKEQIVQQRASEAAQPARSEPRLPQQLMPPQRAPQASASAAASFNQAKARQTAAPSPAPRPAPSSPSPNPVLAKADLIRASQEEFARLLQNRRGREREL